MTDEYSILDGVEVVVVFGGSSNRNNMCAFIGG
jgi:hypothetical protein